MSSESSNDGTLGRIALKQVRVRRSDVEAQQRAANAGRSSARPAENPLNRLVPYLDLFSRLEDMELARLADTAVEHVAQMRRQVDEIGRSLATYRDLIDRLTEDELVRLTQAPPKTVRFWLLCQPRTEDHTAAASSSGTFDQPLDIKNAAAAAGVAPPADSAVADDEFDPVLSFEDDDD